MDDPELWWAAQLQCQTKLDGRSCDRIEAIFFQCRICRIRGLFSNKRTREHHGTIAALRRQHGTSATHTAAIRALSLQPAGGTGDANCTNIPAESTVQCAGQKRTFEEALYHNDYDDDDKDDTSNITGDAAPYDQDDDDSSHSGAEARPVVLSAFEKKANWLAQLEESAKGISIDFCQAFPNDATGYFENQVKGRYKGAESLVARAFHNNSTTSIHPLTAAYALQLTNLASKLSAKDFESLAYILDFIKNPPPEAEQSPCPEVRVPRSPSDMRSLFTTGRNSIRT